MVVVCIQEGEMWSRSCMLQRIRCWSTWRAAITLSGGSGVTVGQGTVVGGRLLRWSSGVGGGGGAFGGIHVIAEGRVIVVGIVIMGVVSGVDEGLVLGLWLDVGIHAFRSQRI